ncbi:MAG TPA: hypothetical protein VJA40_04115 [archaeon]|nr:hypothetical protein [archaeon]
MTIRISTDLVPLAVEKRTREPAFLKINVRNDSPKPQLLSLELRTDQKLSFSKAGTGNSARAELGALEPGQSASFGAYLHPSYLGQNASESAVEITVNEHYQDYAHIVKRHKKSISVRLV